MTMNALTSNLAQKTRDIADNGKTYSNGRSKKNKCSSSQELSVKTKRKRRKNEKRFLYNRCG